MICIFVLLLVVSLNPCLVYLIRLRITERLGFEFRCGFNTVTYKIVMIKDVCVIESIVILLFTLFLIIKLHKFLNNAIIV